MKNCTTCGHSLESNAKFCPECGGKQPEVALENQNSVYSASIGDKNVISGNIIGKSEEFNISGPTTINKIEDETKKFIICAVTGDYLLRGRDIVVNCPKCKSDVSQKSFNITAGRCFNCDKQAYAQYSNKLDTILADGIIDNTEKIQLNAFALSLMIDSTNRQRLENEAWERKINTNLNTIDYSNNELSGFYKIQFKKAITLVFENNDLNGALSILSSVHQENVYHDETAFLYFLIKAIYKPQDYINEYEKGTLFWEHFWAFIPYFKTDDFGKGLKIIKTNKARFSDNKNDTLLCEVLAYLQLFSYEKDPSYIEVAKSLYADFGRNIKQPLFQLHEFVSKLLNSNESEWEILSRDFNSNDRFYYQYVLGGKQAAMVSIQPEQQTNVNAAQNIVEQVSEPVVTQANTGPIEIDENGNCWVDKSLGLRARNNRLFFVDGNGVEYPTLITDRCIWLAKNLVLEDWFDEVMVDGTRDFQDCLPPKWYVPSTLDWNFLASFIAIKNGHSYPLNVSSIEINSDPCTVGDKLVCIDSGNSQLISNGNEYILVNHDNNNIYLYDILNEKYITQPGSSKLVPLGKKRFNLIARWRSGKYFVPVPEQDYSYIHPKYSIANKFGVDYNKTGYVTVVTDNSDNQTNNYGRLIVTKNEGVNLFRLLSGEEDENFIRLLTPVTRDLAAKLVSINFDLPDYLRYDDLIYGEAGSEGENLQEDVASKISNDNSVNAFVQIGDQIWMKKNLDVDTFRNGDFIEHAKSADKWEELGKQGKPAWCYYNNDQSNGEKYGKLYNWHAVNDSRGLAPQGFHIPSKNEADTLMSVSGAQLNEFDEYVLSDAIQSRFLLEGSNEIGISAVLAGRRDSKGVFRGLDQRTGFWTSNENVYEEDDVDDGLIFSLDTSNDEINELNHSNLDEEMGDSWDIASSWSKGCGYSIRCLRTNK